MVIIKAVRWISDKLQEIFLDVSAAMLLILTVAMFYSVVMRYVFNNSPTWSDEVCRYLYVWVQMLGAAIVTRKMTHTAVTFLSDKYRGTLKKVYKVAYNCCFVALGALMLVQGIKYVQVSGNVQMGALAPMQMKWVYVSIPVAGSAMVLQAVRNIMDLIIEWNRQEELSEAEKESIE